MSIKRMSTVWEKSGASGSALLLLLAIADYSDECGVSWPGEETLAQKIRMTARSVRNLTADLVAAGELAKVNRIERGSSNIYVILLDSTPEQLGAAANRVRQLGGVANFSTPGVKGFPGGVEIATSGGVEIAVSYDPSSSVIEPSLHDDDDIHEHDSDTPVQNLAFATEALEERGWNAGEANAAEFIDNHGAAYILEMCEHAQEHKLRAGWIRKNAGTWKPGKNGNGKNGDGGRRDRLRFISGEYADIIEH